MKQKLIAAAFTAIFSLTVLGADKNPATTSTPKVVQKDRTPATTGTPKVDKNQLSYSIGMSIGGNLKRDQVDVNVDEVVAGIKDVLTNQKTKLTTEQMTEVLQAFQGELAAKRTEARKLAGEAGAKEGVAFLADNKKKEGIKTTASGLQYKVIKEGKGATPTKTDTVSVHYKGTLVNGKEFDSSYKRNEPATFPVGGVIPGWTEALQLMKVGSKYQLFIPSTLAYGERGADADIPPNSTLVFEVELLEIQK